MIIKNSNIRRSLFNNRYVIFIIIFVIILLLYFIQVLNNNTKEKFEAENNKIQNTVSYTPKEDESSKATISGESINKTQQTNNTKIIEEFITYCNNKEIEKAYNLLTEECKEEIFASSIQNFKLKYVDVIFTSKKMCSAQSWMNSYGYTYKVKILDDMISTGHISSSENAIEDYYTVVKKDDVYKLNINGYIGRKEYNKQVESNGIKLNIVCKDIYKEYESYDIKIENLTNKTILLDSKEKVDSIYLIGSNENNYSAFSYEVDKTYLIVEPQKEKKLTIRFNKLYSNQVLMRELVFSDIITDYETYEATLNKKDYTNRSRISIEI